jgi:ParB family chromosome partitioning protein
VARKALGKGLDALIPGAGDDRVSAAGEGARPVRPGQAGTVRKVRLSSIRPNPYQPRQEFEREALEELAASIKQKGVLQPVLLRPSEKGYELVAGERRIRAAKLAGLRTIPAIIYDVESEEEMLELSLIENVQREDLNAIDAAQAFRRLSEDCELTQEQIAERVGKSRTAIANTMRLLSLPREVQKIIRSGELSEGHGRALLGLPTKKQQVELARRAARRQLSVRDVERVVRRITEEKEKGGKGGRTRLSPRLQALVEEMQRALGTKVAITGSEKKGMVKIEYYSADDLTRICDRLDINLD